MARVQRTLKMASLERLLASLIQQRFQAAQQEFREAQQVYQADTTTLATAIIKREQLDDVADVNVDFDGLVVTLTVPEKDTG